LYCIQVSLEFFLTTASEGCGAHVVTVAKPKSHMGGALSVHLLGEKIEEGKE